MKSKGSGDGKRGGMIKHILAIIGVLLFVLWFALDAYVRTNAPTHEDIVTGRIYERNYHGTIIYLNETENVLSYALPAAGLLILLSLVLSSNKEKP